MNLKTQIAVYEIRQTVDELKEIVDLNTISEENLETAISAVWPKMKVVKVKALTEIIWVSFRIKKSTNFLSLFERIEVIERNGQTCLRFVPISEEKKQSLFPGYVTTLEGRIKFQQLVNSLCKAIRPLKGL